MILLSGEAENKSKEQMINENIVQIETRELWNDMKMADWWSQEFESCNPILLLLTHCLWCQ